LLRAACECASFSLLFSPFSASIPLAPVPAALLLAWFPGWRFSIASCVRYWGWAASCSSQDRLVLRAVHLLGGRRDCPTLAPGPGPAVCMHAWCAGQLALRRSAHFYISSFLCFCIEYIFCYLSHTHTLSLFLSAPMDDLTSWKGESTLGGLIIYLFIYSRYQ
jgi:hypothetical protein